MRKDALITKPHYAILDGLRGVASVWVIIFHIFEAHSPWPEYQIINHGYLAVDFFFLLSGFVIGYAYDDRWSKMSIGGFFKIRLVRLQPMVVMGMLIGAALFYFQDSVLWPGIHSVPIWKMLLIMLVGFTLIPVLPSMDIRGWQEMHPLNGPGWSLFFEYIANILYGIIVRKFSKTMLSILVLLSAAFLLHLAITDGDVIGGWAVDAHQLHIGFARVLYPFFAGLLLFRAAKITVVKNAFLWCSLLVIAVLSLPRIGDSAHLWMNGLYDSMMIIIVFPIIVYMGASGTTGGKTATAFTKFLGDISYPLYITHYPIIYIYTGWVANNKPGWQQALPYAIITFVASIILAWACLKLYDEPARRWLKKKVLEKNA